MKDYLKEYHVVIRTVGPVFIGSGREIGKKEYIFLDKGKVGITDMQLLYQQMVKKHKQNEFEDYILSDDRLGLTDWLKKNKLFDKDVYNIVNYQLDSGDALVERIRGIQVLECIKDGYGKPYVPGTTLKGMFRNIFLSNDILENPDKYKKYKSEIENEVLSADSNRKVNRKSFLKKQIENIEAAAFRTLGRGEPRDEKSAINDIMQGFIVSDSEPLSVDDLVLCQSVMLHKDGRETKLPILRECIKPDTDICFTITVDESVCKIDRDMIINAIKAVTGNYFRIFQKSFPSAPKLASNNIVIGGGGGYASKTVIYSLFPDKKGVDIVANIFDKTGVPRIHKHYKDNSLGVSPHTLKGTYYQKKLHQMGLCKLVKLSMIKSID